MITPKQNRWYWKEWSKAHKADPTLDRHELHVSALGADKSHKDFTNEEFDLIITDDRLPANAVQQMRERDIRLQLVPLN